MGRYYSGSIDGKFLFGIQSSYAPKRFGGVEREPELVYFHFNNEEHYDDFVSEIELIEDTLGENKQKLDAFLEENSSYTNEQLGEMGITTEMLSDYADLLLGYKIKECLEENGECDIEAEL